MRILPGVLKELLKHVPTVLFEAVEWSILAQELPKLSRRIIKKEGYSELFHHQKALMAPFNVKLVEGLESQTELPKNKKVAEEILTLYFAQLFSDAGLFLDLRPGHFNFKFDELIWEPSALWTQFSPEFSEGLHNIYDGFYLDNEPLYLQGLSKIGLTSPTWPMEDQMTLATLFKEQFGSSLGDEMSFELETFKSSMIKVTDFLLNKKVSISKDFLYLGIYIVSMYASLEKTGAKINVRETYLKVRNSFKNP